MKILLSVLALVALGCGAAEAATVNLVSGANTLLSHIGVTAVVPEPSTWGLMIFGFALVGHQVRVNRKVKA